jgi:hypothetical protein
LIFHLLQQPPPRITWIKVEKPVFDLAGVLVSSLTIAGICIVVAFVLGAAYGLGIILHRRRQPPSWPDRALHLLDT